MWMFTELKLLREQNKNLTKHNEDLTKCRDDNLQAIEKLQSMYQKEFDQNQELSDRLKESLEMNSSLNKALEDGQKAIDLAVKYEKFYEDTLEDFNSVINMLDTLMTKRQMLSDDDDVQNFMRVVSILHDIVVGYTNARSDGKEEDRKEKDK